jgi:HEAT repeat protein
MMSIAEIEAHLAHSDPKVRMRGITALRQYSADVAVPLLASRQTDQASMVRSFVAMGLGYQRNAEAFETLVTMLQTELNANIRSEVANALTKYGRVSMPYIQAAFDVYPDWLMRMSILLALTEMDAPQELFQLCLSAFVDPNLTVRETGVKCLGFLADSEMAEDALLHLLAFALSNTWQVRQQVAIALQKFSDPRAAEALSQLCQDPDYRVVSAVLDGMLA